MRSRTMLFIRIVIISCFSQLLTACVAVPILIDLPHRHHSSPESNGKDHSSFTFSLSGITKAELSPDYDTTPANTDAPELDNNLITHLDGSFGLADRLDGSITIDATYKDNENTREVRVGMIGLKYQFVGQPANQAKPGNFSAAIEFDISNIKNSYTNDNNGNGYRANNNYQGIQLLFGYRNPDNSVAYGKLFQATHHLTGNTTLAGTDYPFRGEVEESGAGFGVLSAGETNPHGLITRYGFELTRHNYAFRLDSKTDTRFSIGLILYY
ncbi:MAG: hypothetical protein OEZ39_15940 [Gammaproteobacteria bacterium]|nr:hypothetical protein [Gammaproteobacteria bacterium]MDH5653349.1 hypothetical protein [Gammaproteobacteria bacterium]